MFGDEGARAAKLAAYASLVAPARTPRRPLPRRSDRSSRSRPGFRLYYQRSIFSYRRVNIDVSVERERFPVRQLPPASRRRSGAMFHAVMGRPVEARAAIAEARKADPSTPASYVAEGLLADRDNKPEEAKAAYTKAAELGDERVLPLPSRVADVAAQRLTRGRTPRSSKHLTKAVGFNTRYAARLRLAGRGAGRISATPTRSASSAGRSSIEPTEASHRLRAADVLLRQGKPAEARVEAPGRADAGRHRRGAAGGGAAAGCRVEGPLRRHPHLPRARPRRRRFVRGPRRQLSNAPATPPLATITRARRRHRHVAGTASAAAPLRADALGDMNALNAECQSGDATACSRMLPWSKPSARRKSRRRAASPVSSTSAAAAWPTNAALAASFYNQACDAGDRMGCVGFALLQARGNGVVQNVAKAQAT